MNEPEKSTRINCTIRGNAVQTLAELKRRGIVQNNREAVVQALLALQETIIKSDIQKNNLRNQTEQKMYLAPWNEVLGTLNGIETADTELIAFLTCTSEKHTAIAIQREPETEQQLRKLLGQKVAILRTDNPQTPLIIRPINNTKTPTTTDVTGKEKAKPRIRPIGVGRNCGFAFCSAAVG
jgi:hypothetical protein